MSSIWIDKENTTNLAVPNGAKAMLSARKHSVKKQAFGELKNIINQKQNIATPFKGSIKSDIFVDPSKSLCKDVLKKQQLKQNFSDAQQMLEKQIRTKQVLFPKTAQKSRQVYESYEFSDYAGQCIGGNCTKRDVEIWNEMNMPGDEFFNKLMQGACSDDDEENGIPNVIEDINDEIIFAEDKFLKSNRMDNNNGDFHFDLELPDITEIINALPEI